MQEALDERAAVHGVPRRRRRAGRRRGRRRAAAAAGQLQRLRARRRRRWSSRSSRRSRRARPTSLGLDVEGVVERAAAPGGGAGRGVGRARRRRRARARARSRPPRAASSWPTSPARCWPTATVRGLRRRPGRRRAGGRDADLRAAAPAGSTCRAPGAKSATRSCSSSRCRCCATAGRSRVSCAARRGLRAAAAPPAPEPARTASCARSASARTTATCCSSPSAASSASARRAGRCAPATRVPAAGRAHARGSTDFGMPDDLWARSRCRSASPSCCAAASRRPSSRMYPSPAGATECELELTAWDALRAANPVLETSSPTPRR